MRKVLISTMLAATALTSAPAFAVATYDDLSAWQSAVGSFNRDTDYGSSFSDITSLALDDGTALGFGSSVNVRDIGGGWSTWSGGYTGQVLYSNGANSLSVSLSAGVNALGFFVEPNPFSTYTFNLSLSDGSNQSGSYDGSGGAGFLGFSGPGITGFTLSSDTDFALGDFYTGGAVPEPASWALMIFGFGAVGVSMRRAKVRTRVGYAAA